MRQEIFYTFISMDSNKSVKIFLAHPVNKISLKATKFKLKLKSWAGKNIYVGKCTRSTGSIDFLHV